MGINIQNKKKKINNKIIYNILDVDVVSFEIPPVQFDAQVTMSCGDFQKYCRELATVAHDVTISISSDKVFSMKVDGGFASQSLDIEESDDSNVVITLCNEFDGVKEIGTYFLKKLNLFCKSSTLCNIIQLYIKEQYPIIIVYTVASLGTLRFCLSGKEKVSDDE